MGFGNSESENDEILKKWGKGLDKGKRGMVLNHLEETGGLLLLGKLDKAFEAGRGYIDPDDYHEYKENPDDEFEDFIIEHVNKRLPPFNDSQLVRGWIGWCPITPDRLTILGQTWVKGFLCAVSLGGARIHWAPP